MNEPQLSIGAVAERTGVSVTALRYYEELGLIASGDRVGGQRRFGPHIVDHVNFVRRAQDVGLSLEEIRQILDDENGRWQEIVDSKLTDLHQQRTSIDGMIELLTEMRRCGCQAVTACRDFPEPAVGPG